VSSPLALVVLGGILNAVYLLLVSVATLYLSFRKPIRASRTARCSPPPVDLGGRGRRRGHHLARQHP
jgi:hypothetical protein